MNTHIPNHVAVIMDGNRRWAKEKNLPTYKGHKKGISNVKELITGAQSLGINVMTFYCFSTENWKRSKTEVSYLMKLFTSYVEKNIKEITDNNVHIRQIGRKDRLPTKLLNLLQKADEISKMNTGLTVNLALDYGGRDEIIRAIQTLKAKDEKREITETVLAEYLDTYPDTEVDLLIRTSGENRISNFLIWEASYAELHFEDIYFPDFSVEIFTEIVENYAERKRRFGG